MELLGQIAMGMTGLMIVTAFLSKIFKAFGWDKGAYIADKLQEALNEVREEVHGVARGELKVDDVAATVASNVSGLTAEEAKPLIEAAAAANPASAYGVTVDLDTEGNITVDPSGLINKSAYKISKWFKKVF